MNRAYMTKQRKNHPPRLYDPVVRELTSLVVSGRWPPGYLVPTEAELCDHFGISRTVLREAMQLVVDKGLMIVRQGKGTIVAPQAQWDLLDPLVLGEGLRHAVPGIADHVVEVRRLLEPAAAGLAAERATPDQVEHIAQIAREVRSHFDDPVKHFELTSQFHEAIVNAAGNPVLSRIFTSIQIALRIWRSGLAEQSLSMLLSQHEEHEQILAAVRAGDREAAAQAMAAHIANGFGVYIVRALAKQSLAGV